MRQMHDDGLHMMSRTENAVFLTSARYNVSNGGMVERPATNPNEVSGPPHGRRKSDPAKMFVE